MDRVSRILRALTCCVVIVLVPIALTTFAAPSVEASQRPSATVFSWSKPKKVAPYALFAISCASLRFCVATDDVGGEVTYNGRSWSRDALIDPVGRLGQQTFLSSVSCPTSNFCAAVDENGNALIFNGKGPRLGWEVPEPVDPKLTITSVSCPSPSFCVAGDAFGDVSTYDGTSWSPPQDFSEVRGFFSVSCENQNFCWVLGGDCLPPANCVFSPKPTEDAVSYDNGAWSAPESIDPGQEIASVSCQAGSLCVAVDAIGQALVYNDGTWSKPQQIDHAQLMSIACPSTTFCVAVDRAGYALSFDPANLSQIQRTEIDPNKLVDHGGVPQSISCPDPSHCFVVEGADLVIGST